MMHVLLVDDDPILRAALAEAMELADIAVAAEPDAHAALARIDIDFPGVVLTDIRMPGLDGVALFERIRAIDPAIPVLLMTGHGDVATAVRAFKDGAFDFLSKPFDIDQAMVTIRRALATRKLVLDNRSLRAAAEAVGRSDEILIGETPVMRRLRATIGELADADVDVLIEGETGTGKELVALLLHRGGKRRARPFVAVNCAGLSRDIAETELLGRADTLALRERAQTGRIAASDHGTLFLDEIESLPLEIQGQLLRVIEEREVRPVGGDRPIALDLRIVAAGKIDLEAAAAAGAFRTDLLYRLNAIRLRIPALRERREDIPLLFAHFLAAAADRHSRPIPDVTAETLARFADHNWPGNVRELRNVAQQVVLGIGRASDMTDGAGRPLPERLRLIEAMLMREALSKTAGDVHETIRILGIPRKTFYHKVRLYEIDLDLYRGR